MIRKGSFEKMDPRVICKFKDLTTPRTTPTGTDKLSKQDFLISKLKYRR